MLISNYFNKELIKRALEKRMNEIFEVKRRRESSENEKEG